MERHEVAGHYGARLILNQCPECKGIWVDRDVVFGVSRDSAVDVESEVELGEIETKPREAPLWCPNCEVHLKERTGMGFPAGLRVDYCSGCHGFWFDKGELMIYKSYLEDKRKKSGQRTREREAELKKRRRFNEQIKRSYQPGSRFHPVSHSVGSLLVRSLIDFLFGLK